MDSLIDRAREQILGPRRELAELKAKGSFNTQIRRMLWETHGIATPQPLARLTPKQRAGLKAEIRKRPWMGDDWWGEIMGVTGSNINQFIQS